MTNKNDPELDAMLHAFVDGELDAQADQEMRRRLEADPDAQARADAYAAQGAALHDAYDSVLDEPLPAAMRAALAGGAAHTPSWSGPLLRLAAAIVLFVAGGVGGWWGHGLTAPDTAQVVADGSPYVSRAIGAHVVYAAEVAHPVEVGADEERHLVAWLTKRLGRDVRAPKLTAAGFDLVGGRLLPDDDAKPAAQFMYENRAGQRVTLYVSLDPERTETSFRFAEGDGTSAIYWVEGGLGYALAGSLSRDEMLKVARLVYDALIA